MKEQIENRLKELKAEFQSGQKMLADLEAQQANLKNTLLRISGAIQVLEEMLVPPNVHSPESYPVVSQPD
jgi:predicted nuclease with TOPRIM domain